MERDVQLDCYRALTMIYIVCVIHIVRWFGFGNEIVRSLLLFEMPVIFFIAGASQSYKRVHPFIQTVISRIKRVLLPYYIFLVVLLLFYSACTFLGITFKDSPLDIYSLDIQQFIKMLLTGGNKDIPYFGYTWFISCYLIVSCLLPLQKGIMKKISPNIYVLVVLCMFILWKIINISSPENIIENVLCYNFFFILGFVYYRRLKAKFLFAISLLPLMLSAYWFMSGIAIPMQEHKFPPDIIFLIFCFGILCILALSFSRIKIKYNYILRLWNERGYTIYLYQTISHFFLYKLTISFCPKINNEFIVFIIYFILVFIIASALSFITFPLERNIISRLKKY